MAQPPKGKGKLLWLVVTAIAVVVIVGLYAALSLGPARGPPASQGGSGGGYGGGSGGGSRTATLTTLAAIVDGNFTSAMDKQGDGGSYVEVRDVVVFKVVKEELDGDWHVYIRDPTYSQFISEIIPRDQTGEGQPPLDVPLVVWGITYCDVEHQNAAWHGYTCWEIHPLTSWERV